MQRVNITRSGKTVGALEVPDSEQDVFQPSVALPGLAGDSSGFAIVIELNNRPAAAVIFPFDGDAIELTHPFHWYSDTDILSDPEQMDSERARLSDSVSIVDLEGIIGASREGDRFRFEVFVKPQKEAKSKRSGSFQLRIDDGEDAYVHFDVRDRKESEGPDRGFLRGKVNVCAKEGFSGGDFSFVVLGDYMTGDGKGHGHLRSSSANDGTEAGILFNFDFIGPGLGIGTGTLRGETAGFPILSIIERTITRIGAAYRALPFRFWIGVLRYPGEAPGVRRARLQLAERLARSRSFSVADCGQVAQLIAQAIPVVRRSEFARALAPLFEVMTDRPRLGRIQRSDLDIEFGETVLPETALKFLLAFGSELERADGRLCLRERHEGEQ